MTTEPKAAPSHPLEVTEQKIFITPARIGIALFFLLTIGTGVVALMVEPIYIVGVIIASLFGLLIILYPYFGLLLYYLVLVVNPGVVWPQLAVFHPDTIFAGFLIFSLVIHQKFKGEKFIFFQKRMTWHLLLLVLAMCLSVPFSVWPALSFRTLIEFIKIVAFYLLIINIITTETRLKGFIWLFILANGYDAISSAIAYFRGTLVLAQGIERAASLSGADPNTLAVSLVLAIPFMVYAFIWTESRILKALAIGLAAAAFFTVAITGSRAGVIGLCVVTFFIWLNSPKRVLAAAIFLLVMAAGWVVLPQQYKARYSSIFSSQVDPSTKGRFEAWKAGLGMFFSRPFTGVGVGNFAVAYGSGDYSDRRSWLKAHSLYIQLVAELGLLGVATFVPLVWYMMRQNFRLRKRMRQQRMEYNLVKWLSYSITCSVGALFFTSVFGHSLFRTHWYWSCALTVVLWALVDKVNNESRQRNEQQLARIPRPLPR